jgi:hypothetical protein
VSGGFSNKRTLTHMEGIDGNSSVFDSFTLIDKETVNFTIN